MKKRVLAYTLLACSLLLMSAAESNNPDAVLGRWLSSHKRNQVLLYRQGNQYFGKVIWMLEPNDPVSHRPKVDKQNPDPSLRNRTVMNLVVMSDLTYKGNNEWGNGRIYNPEDGRTYGCDLILKDANTLEVKGYVIGLSLISKSKVWTRVP